MPQKSVLDRYLKKLDQKKKEKRATMTSRQVRTEKHRLTNDKFLRLFEEPSLRFLQSNLRDCDIDFKEQLSTAHRARQQDRSSMSVENILSIIENHFVAILTPRHRRSNDVNERPSAVRSRRIRESARTVLIDSDTLVSLTGSPSLYGQRTGSPFSSPQPHKKIVAFRELDHPLSDLIVKFGNMFHGSYSISPEMHQQRAQEQLKLKRNRTRISGEEKRKELTSVDRKIRKWFRKCVSDIKLFIEKFMGLCSRVYPETSLHSSYINQTRLCLHRVLFDALSPTLMDLYQMKNQYYERKFARYMGKLSGLTLEDLQVDPAFWLLDTRSVVPPFALATSTEVVPPKVEPIPETVRPVDAGNTTAETNGYRSQLSRAVAVRRAGSSPRLPGYAPDSDDKHNLGVVARIVPATLDSPRPDFLRHSNNGMRPRRKSTSHVQTIEHKTAGDGLEQWTNKLLSSERLKELSHRVHDPILVALDSKSPSPAPYFNGSPRSSRPISTLTAALAGQGITPSPQPSPCSSPSLSSMNGKLPRSAKLISLATPERVPYFEAVDELLQIREKLTPEDKIACIAACATKICSCIDDFYSERSTSPLSITPDDLLSLFAFILIQSNIQTMVSEIDFVETFVIDPLRNDMSGYYLATLRAAMQLITNDVKQLVERQVKNQEA